MGPTKVGEEVTSTDDPTECKVCGEEYSVDEECEADGFCHGCAHDLAAHASEAEIRRAKRRLQTAKRVRSSDYSSKADYFSVADGYYEYASFEGPATEHDDAGFELLPCVGCQTLTGMGGGFFGRDWGPLCMRCGNICHCDKCQQMRADKRLTIEVEQKLEGSWKPIALLPVAPPAKRYSRTGRPRRSTTVRTAKP